VETALNRVVQFIEQRAVRRVLRRQLLKKSLTSISYVKELLYSNFSKQPPKASEADAPSNRVFLDSSVDSVTYPRDSHDSSARILDTSPSTQIIQSVLLTLEDPYTPTNTPKAFASHPQPEQQQHCHRFGPVNEIAIEHVNIPRRRVPIALDDVNQVFEVAMEVTFKFRNNKHTDE
jgi:hypothetical protein